MKLKRLQGIWKNAAIAYHQSTASEIVGWYYSRYCMSDTLDKKSILGEVQQIYPKVINFSLDPFVVMIYVAADKTLKIKYRSTGTRIGYTYYMEELERS